MVGRVFLDCERIEFQHVCQNQPEIDRHDDFDISHPKIQEEIELDALVGRYGSARRNEGGRNY